MKKLLLEMYRMDEAPDYQNAFAPSEPTMSQSAYETPDAPEQPEQDDQHVNPHQGDIDKNNLLQRLFTLLTQLTQAKTPKSESCVSNIAKVLYEEMELVEAELSNQGTIAKLEAEIDDVVSKLQPYANSPDVKSAFQRVQSIKNANYTVAPKYTGSFTPEKLKRFNAILAKAGKPSVASATANTTTAATNVADTAKTAEPTVTQPTNVATTTTNTASQPTNTSSTSPEDEAKFKELDDLLRI